MIHITFFETGSEKSILENNQDLIETKETLNMLEPPKNKTSAQLKICYISFINISAYILHDVIHLYTIVSIILAYGTYQKT